MSDRFIRHLGEAGYGRESGFIGELNLLARTGLPVPEGVVLTRKSHQAFMEASGLLQGIRAATGEPQDARWRALEAQSEYCWKPVEGELSRAICEALIELGVSTVAVLSEDLTESGLGSIPEVRAAVRNAWLSLEGLRQQIEAAARGEDVPTWPVLVQHELHPEYTGRSTVESLVGKESRTGRPDKGNVALYDVKPADGARCPDRKRIAHLTEEAENLLGGPVRLEWGLKGGRWYILSTNPLPRC